MTNTLQIKYSDKSDATLEKDELLRGEIALNIKDDKLFYRSALSDEESSDSVKSIPLLSEEELKQLIKDNAPQGLQHFEDSTWDSDEYKSVLLKPKNEDSNTTVCVCPKGTGAFTLSDYGVKLGEKSVDLQIYNYSPVKTNYSVCTGGTGNNINSDYSVICGGGWNTIQDSSQGFIGGGVSNSLRGWNSAILCGSNNEINGNDANFIACGKENKMLGLEWKKDKITEKTDPYHAKFSFIAGTDNILQGEANAIIGYNNSIRGDSYTYTDEYYGGALTTIDTEANTNFIHGFENSIAGYSLNTIIGSQGCEIKYVVTDDKTRWKSSHCACISSFNSKLINSSLVATIGTTEQRIYNSTEVFLGPVTSNTHSYKNPYTISNSKRVAVLAGDISPCIQDSTSVFWPLCVSGYITKSDHVYVLSCGGDHVIGELKDPTTKESTEIGSRNISIHNAYNAKVYGSLNLFSSANNFASLNTASTLLLNSDGIEINGGSSLPSSSYSQDRDSQYNNVIGSRGVKLVKTGDILNLSSHDIRLGGAWEVTLIQCNNISDNTKYSDSDIDYREISAKDIKSESTIYESSIINSRDIFVVNSSRLSINNVRIMNGEASISNVSLAKLDCSIDGKLKNGYSIEGFGPRASNLGMSNHSYRCMSEGTDIKYIDGYWYNTNVPAEFALITGLAYNNSNPLFQTGKVYLQLVTSEPDISKPTFMTKANYAGSTKRPDASNASFIVVPVNGYMFFDFKADFVNGNSVCTIEMKNGVLHNDHLKIEVIKQPVVSSNDTSAKAIQLSIAQIEQETELDVMQVAISVDSTLDDSAFASGVFDYRLMYFD